MHGPGSHLGTTLSRKDLSSHNVLRLDLGDNQGGKDSDDEQGEHSVLQRSVVFAKLEESERGDQGDSGVTEQAGELQ